MKSLLSDVNNSQMIMIRKMKLLLLNESINPLEKVREAHKVLSFIESIFKSGTTGAVFIYLLDHGAATAWLLQVNLEIPEASAYRAIKRLRALKLITPEWRITNRRVYSRVREPARGGPRTVVWALLDASAEDVARAVRDHRRSLSPNYRVAEEFVQYLIEDFIQDGITRDQIMDQANRKLTMSKQRIRSVSELAAVILKEKGVKVWR